MLNRFKIGTRLIGGFLFVVFLLIIVFGGGYNGLKSISRESDNILKMANYMYYPPRSKLKNEQGKVIMEITTNSNGEIIQINIKNSISKDIDKESVRILLKYFPKVKNWKGTYPLKFGLY